MLVTHEKIYFILFKLFSNEWVDRSKDRRQFKNYIT